MEFADLVAHLNRFGFEVETTRHAAATGARSYCRIRDQRSDHFLRQHNRQGRRKSPRAGA